jgi:hypothetical protein
MDGDRLFYVMAVVVALIGVGLFAIPVRAEPPPPAATPSAMTQPEPRGGTANTHRENGARVLQQYRVERQPERPYSTPRHARSWARRGGVGLVLGIGH